MLARLPRLAFARLHYTPSTPRFSSTMSKDDQQPPQQQEGSNATATTAKDNKNPLPLPGPDQDTAASASSSNRGDDVTTLRVGESVRLDALGPLIVNTDGTMGRVGNWAGMTENEKQQTLKLLARRNKQRLEVLRAKNDEEEQK
ncbi:hypothetical protein FSARC_7482 [Fusarium sarcochroum]|uniref:Uncharacterized protein n=1 Tax=Fusarium sarcochroum TaxID=1208366 RepID=A0A8H4TVC0_9HYPO|nr:hypothetical protein FSARC_7482 [Fusarium sarcochroum]